MAQGRQEKLLTELNIVNHMSVADTRTAYLVEQFHTVLPELNLNFTEMDIDQYLLSMLAADDKIDIAFLYRTTLLNCARVGALLPLDEEPQIMAALNKTTWLPFESLLSLDGHLYGIPFYYLPDLLSYDKRVADNCGFTLPSYPYTWDDLIPATRNAGLDGMGAPCLLRENLSNPVFLMTYLSQQYYHTGTVHFDTEEFRKTAKTYSALVNEGVILDFNDEPLRDTILNRGTASGSPVFYPQIGSEPSIIVDMYAFSIPADSSNIEPALLFLEQYLLPECQHQVFLGNSSYMLLKSSDGYNDEYLEMYPNYNEELRQYIGDHWIPRFGVPAFIQYLNESEIFYRYLKGDIALDDLIVTLQEKLDMILFE